MRGPNDAGNGSVRGDGGSSRSVRGTGPGGIPSAPGSFSGGFSGFEDGGHGLLPLESGWWPPSLRMASSAWMQA